MQYKHREGSDLERRALYHGYEELMKEVHDMTFEIPEATYSFGEDVTLQVGTHCTDGGCASTNWSVCCVQVTMFNKAKQHTVKGSIVCEAVDYTGKVCIPLYLPLDILSPLDCGVLGVERSSEVKSGQESK